MVEHEPHARRGTARRALPLLLIAALACTGERTDASPDAPISVVDDAGHTVVLERPARRVISLIPAQTEIVTILAGVDAVIARTQWDEDPRLAHLPSLGNALTPSVEWLAAQQPDLIIAWPDAQSRDVVRRLNDIGIPTYASAVESVDEIRSMIERLGVLLGTVDRADSLMHALDAQLDSVRREVAGRDRPSVLYLLSADPPMAAGPGTYIDDLITIAGGTNVFGDLAQLWPQVALEEIVRRQPDVIIRPTDTFLDDALAGLANRPGWRELRAVRTGRVYPVDPDLYNRAGATVGRAARGLADLIHRQESDR